MIYLTVVQAKLPLVDSIEVKVQDALPKCLQPQVPTMGKVVIPERDAGFHRNQTSKQIYPFVLSGSKNGWFCQQHPRVLS